MNTSHPRQVEPSFESAQRRQMRRLLRLLAVSGLLNVALIVFLAYDQVRDPAPVIVYDSDDFSQSSISLSLSVDQSNVELIEQFRSMELEELLSFLSDPRLVEDGYSKRDLALAALVTFHHFDISRALLGHPQPTQQRRLVVESDDGQLSLAVIVYPGLDEEQFEAIGKFAATERWPLTSLGLFEHLKQSTTPTDSSLMDAFYVTPDFLAMEMLFNRADVPVEKAELLDLVCAGDWMTLARFVKQQRRTQDLSPERRRQVLVDYLDHGSQSAALLMLKTDYAYALRKLNDARIVTILDQLDDSISESQQFALESLASSRSDAVWHAAATFLYSRAGEQLPVPLDLASARQRFLPPEMLERNTAVTFQDDDSSPEETKDEAVAETLHVIKRGDSLWKISRQYKVSIDAIRRRNQLDSDFLKPGKQLVIPAV